jgi:hypothetical protein
MIIPTCKTCPYRRYSECRRNPPQMIMDSDSTPYSYWPDIESHDWCGDHPMFSDVVVEYLASLKQEGDHHGD